MSKLIEAPITLMIKDEKAGKEKPFESELFVELPDIKEIFRTELGEVHAIDLYGNHYEINVEFEEFKGLWLLGRKAVKLDRKAKGYQDIW
jgi:hypothetical protein